MALYKRSNSKYWWMKFTFDGELIQRSTNVANKRDAQTIESAFRTQLALGKIGIEPLKTAPTFEKAVEDFLIWSKVKHAAKPDTFIRLEYSCQSLKNYFGKTKVNKIKVENVEAFILWRSKQTSKKTGKPITRDTINLELIALKTIFKRLVAEKCLRENPTENVKQLQKNDRNFHVLTLEEEKRYLLACPQPLQDVAALMLETGMRPDEVYQLKKQNVSLDKEWLKVEGGKTASSNRKVWLSEKAAKILKSRIERFNGDNLFPKGDRDWEEPTYQLNNQHQETRNKLGYKFRLYDCRHTFASRTLENGTDLLTLASILGHSSLDQVMRYAHPSEEHKAEAMKQKQSNQSNLHQKATLLDTPEIKAVSKS